LAILNSIYREGETKLRIGFSPLLPAVLAALLLIIPASYKTGENAAVNAISAANSGDVQKGMTIMKRAISADPKNAKYRIDYANMIKLIASKGI
ncbi:MAG TPA: hypothetical protein PLH63_09540, partial [Candidatus Cloacimonadota bacterium]|nr:hypothetical protein [Candidatus Cloacimonadota bacterium]